MTVQQEATTASDVHPPIYRDEQNASTLPTKHTEVIQPEVELISKIDEQGIDT